jgi:hypothetical protein
MTGDEARTAVRATLAVMAGLAGRTHTSADNLIVQILQANEAKLSAAVLQLANDPVQPPTAERVAEVLAAVGIKI